MNKSLIVTIDGKQFDLSSANNVLIVGATGSGKSVFLHKLIANLQANYGDAINLILIDLKQTEFFNYDQAIFDLPQSQQALQDLLQQSTNATEDDKPTVLICDEATELAIHSQAFKLLSQLAKSSNNANVCLVLATQRCDWGRGTAKLKKHLQTRLCFRVASKADSIKVLGIAGAENLKTGEFLHNLPPNIKHIAD